MIIVEPVLKDTFVTDMYLKENNGAVSNFGQASVLDMFKIKSENKKVKARALIVLNNSAQIQTSDVVELQDYLGNTYKFNFGDVDPTVLASFNLAAIDLVDEMITVFRANISNISVYKLENNKIMFEQNYPGVSGEKEVTLTITNASAITKYDFKIFEHSAILLKFDLKSLLETHISNKSNSVFKTVDNSPNYIAQISMKDVGFATTRPRDYRLRARVLLNDFNEGLGNDIVHFSDIGDANFKSIDSKKSLNWSTERIVSESDTYVYDDNGTNIYFDEYTPVLVGEENVVFDMTSYVDHYFSNNGVLDLDNDGIAEYEMPQTFVIDFEPEYLFDDYTYFIKRLGSRNLSKKINQPSINLKISDKDFLNIDLTNKKRFLGSTESFYLTNLINNNLTAFDTDTFDIKAKISYKDSIVASSSMTMLKVPTNSLFEFSIEDSYQNSISILLDLSHQNNLQEVPGGNNEYTIGIQNLTIVDIIAKIKQQLEANTGNDAGKLLKSLSYQNNNQTLVVVNDDNGGNNLVSLVNNNEQVAVLSHVSEQRNVLKVSQVDPLLDVTLDSVYNYKGEEVVGIKKLVINDVNESLVTRFIANSKYQKEIEDKGYAEINIYYYFKHKVSNVEYKIKSEDVKFYIPESNLENQLDQIRVVINSRQKNIIANNTIQDLEISFVDVIKQYASVNVPFDIYSLDVGDVEYEMYNVDTLEKIIFKDSNDSMQDYSKIFFNGKYYVLKLFASSLYKNIRAGFRFKYVDPLTGLTRNIQDKSLIVSFK
jgi:hypothetical protein